MREVISISLPSEIKAQIEEAASQQGVSRSDIIREALNDYLFAREFRRLRKKARAEVEAKKGRPYSDEDVFNEVS